MPPAPTHPTTRWALGLAMVVFTGVVAFALVEGLLRLTGHRPWRYLRWDHGVVHEPDAVLGWRARAGSHVLPPYAPGAAPIHMAFLPDGGRVTDAPPTAPGGDVVFAGCSFMQGWAISDAETCPWRVQRKLHDRRVSNYATAAYGTYQSLLVLERIFAESPTVPRTVLYGFIDAHEMRNIAHPDWLFYLQATCSRTSLVSVPYCTLDGDGALERHPPLGYPRWPLREWSATVAFLERRWAQFSGRSRPLQARAVTERLLLAMHDLTRRHEAHFAVVLLHLAPEARAHYAGFLRDHGVDVIDCDYPLTPSMIVPGEVHPNGAMHARWAGCILRALSARKWIPGDFAQSGRTAAAE